MKRLIVLLLLLRPIISFGQIWPVDVPITVNVVSSHIVWIPPCGERYHENGNLQSRCGCVNDTIHGKYTRWLENGMKYHEETYDMGTLKKRVHWYENGRIETVRHYHDIQHCYKIVRWSPEGHKQEIEHFDWDGEYHGVYYSYFEDGHLAEQQEYVHGVREGLRKMYNYDHRECIVDYIQENKRHGEFKKWYDDVLVEHGQYVKGKKEGTWLIYDSKEPNIRSEIQFQSGEKKSEKKIEDNLLISSMDNISGEYVEYFSNGSKQKEWYYQKEKRSGHQREWDDHGNLIADYYLVGNKYCDTSIFYNNDGTYRQLSWMTFEIASNRHYSQDKYLEEYLMSANGDTLEQRIILNSVKDYNVITTNLYENNQREGNWRLVDLKNGIIIKEVTYENGFLNGPFSSSIPSTITHFGNKAKPQKTVYHIVGNYKNNQLDGEWVRSYSTDSNDIIMEEAHYKNGLLEGSRILYTHGRAREYSNYHLGKLHGEYKTQWPGSLETIETGTYQMGVKHGLWIRHRDELMTEHGWTGRGAAYEGHFNLGVREGHWKHYGLFGHLESEGNYTNGEPDGHWIFYWKDWEAEDRDNPIKASEGTLKGKEKMGIWKRYNEKGKLHDKLNFEKHPFLHHIYG